MTMISVYSCLRFFFFFQAEDGIRDKLVTGVQTCALPIYDFPQVSPQAEDHLLQEIVRERPRELHPRELHGDGARLGGADPNRQHPLPFLLLEDDHRRVCRAIESQMRDPNLNLVRAQVPISHDARYFFCSGVSGSIATPIAASFSRAMSASSSRGIRCTSFVSSRACRTTCSAASA